jgi:hypothetical protein
MLVIFRSFVVAARMLTLSTGLCIELSTGLCITLSTGLCIELSTGCVDIFCTQVIHRVWTVTNLYTSSIDLTQCYTMLQLNYRGLPCLSPALVWGLQPPSPGYQFALVPYLLISLYIHYMIFWAIGLPLISARSNERFKSLILLVILYHTSMTYTIWKNLIEVLLDISSEPKRCSRANEQTNVLTCCSCWGFCTTLQWLTQPALILGWPAC